MFFDKGFTCLHLSWIERVNFGDFGGEIWVKFDVVVIGVMRGKLIMGFLWEDICEVFTPFGYNGVNQLSGLGNLDGNGDFVDLFSS